MSATTYPLIYPETIQLERDYTTADRALLEALDRRQRRVAMINSSGVTWTVSRSKDGQTVWTRDDERIPLLRYCPITLVVILMIATWTEESRLLLCL